MNEKSYVSLVVKEKYVRQQLAQHWPCRQVMRFRVADQHGLILEVFEKKPIIERALSYLSFLFRCRELVFIFWPLLISWVYWGGMRIEAMGLFAFGSVVSIQLAAYHFQAVQSALSGEDWYWKGSAIGILDGKVSPEWVAKVGWFLLFLSSGMGTVVIWTDPMAYLPPVLIGLLGFLFYLLPQMNKSVLALELTRALVYGPVLIWGLGLFFKAETQDLITWSFFGLGWALLVLMDGGLKHLKKMLVLSRARQSLFFLRFGGFDKVSLRYLLVALLHMGFIVVFLYRVDVRWSWLVVVPFVGLFFVYSQILKIKSPLSSKLSRLSLHTFLYASFFGLGLTALFGLQ